MLILASLHPSGSLPLLPLPVILPRSGCLHPLPQVLPPVTPTLWGPECTFVIMGAGPRVRIVLNHLHSSQQSGLQSQQGKGNRRPRNGSPPCALPHSNPDPRILTQAPPTPSHPVQPGEGFCSLTAQNGKSAATAASLQDPRLLGVGSGGRVVHCFPVIIVWGSVQLSMPGRLAGRNGP